MDNSNYKPLPIALSVHRRSGAVRIHWAPATDDAFLQLLRALIGIGEAVLEQEEKERPEAAPPAPGQGKSSSKDS